jgi:hypothetical protein
LLIDKNKAEVVLGNGHIEPSLKIIEGKRFLSSYNKIASVLHHFTHGNLVLGRIKSGNQVRLQGKKINYKIWPLPRRSTIFSNSHEDSFSIIKGFL